ncbi:MAG: 2-oxoisovalerate dehydrogenase [Verrucomicrobiota bacterium]
MNDLELVFRVCAAEEGGFTASYRLPDGLIVTQGDTWQELEAMMRDAVSCHFAVPDEAVS